MNAVDFQKDVIARSFEIPVVVDFWAPWCGPCRVLGPVIETLAEAQEGRWELVKVNTEEQPAVAQQYRIMSIPNVKLFRNGQVIDEFTGAQPRTAIEKWLDLNIPSADQEALEELLELPEEQRVEALSDFVEQYPGNKRAKLELAKLSLPEAAERVATLVQDITVLDEGHDLAEHLTVLADFLRLEIPADTPAGKALWKTQQAFSQKDAEAAAQFVIEATTIDKNFMGELPRKIAIALFNYWGDQHPVSKNYRWRFDMALY